MQSLRTYLLRSLYLVPPLLLVLAIFTTNRAPVVTDIGPNTATDRRDYEITGRNFGSERNGSYVVIDGEELTHSHYLEWSTTRIVITVPSDTSSGILRVVTSDGESNATLYTNTAHAAQRTVASQKGRPYIQTHTPLRPSIGEIITIEGYRFGPRRSSSAVYFNWQDSEGERNRLAVPNEHHQHWSHRQVVFRIPSGVPDGWLTLETSYGESNTYRLALNRAGGNIRYTHPLTIALHYGVGVGEVESEWLYLWLPFPSEGAAQQRVRTLYRNYRADYLIDSQIEGIRLMPRLTPQRSFERSLLLQRYQIEHTLNQRAIPARYPSNDSLLTDPSPLVPADHPVISELSRSIALSAHPLARARQIYNLVIDTLSPHPRSEQSPEAIAPHADIDIMLQSIAGASSEQPRAHPYHYALIGTALLRAARIPARPVAGYLAVPRPHRTVRGYHTAPQSGGWRLIPHYWSELYLPSVGWIPIDAAMGDGYSRPPPSVISVTSATPPTTHKELASLVREFYFGNLDPYRLTIQRGWRALPSIQRGTTAPGSTDLPVFLSHRFEFAQSLDTERVSLYPVRLIGVPQ